MPIYSRIYIHISKDMHTETFEIWNLDFKSLRFSKISIVPYLFEINFSYFYHGKNLLCKNILLPRKQEQMHVQYEQKFKSLGWNHIY